MTNNKLCGIIGLVGCAICGLGAELMIVGFRSAIWGVGAGIVIAISAYFNYD